MANFEYLGKTINYTVNGEKGPYLLFLNGIMMSCKSWDKFIPSLSKDNRFICLDFFDQGLTDTMEEPYKQNLQADLVKALLDHLNIDKITIMGVSYGGEVAMQFCLKYPDCVDRLMLFNTTSWTSMWLRDCGRAWNSVGKTLDGNAYYNLTIPFIYAPSFYIEKNNWMENRRELLEPLFSTKEFQNKMERLVNSAEGYDIRNRVEEINKETLIVSCQYDFITPLFEQEFIHSKIKHSSHIVIPNAGHAFMYENPQLFLSLVLGFLNKKDIEISI